MMKYLLCALLVTAIAAQDFEDAADFEIDNLLEDDTEMPCTPKPCMQVCKPVKKTISNGPYSIEYIENVCVPDDECLAAAAACQAKIMSAMEAAAAAEADMTAKYSASQMAKADHAEKVAAAAQAKKEAALAKEAMDGATAAAQVATSHYAGRSAEADQAETRKSAAKAEMDKAVKKAEAAKQDHLDAVAVHKGADSAAAKAAAKYKDAVKAHCDAEALHAKLVTDISHAHLAQKKCAKHTFCPNRFPAYSQIEAHAKANKEICYLTEDMAKGGSQNGLGCKSWCCLSGNCKAGCHVQKCKDFA